MVNIKPSTLAIHNPWDNSLKKNNKKLLYKDAFTCLNFDGKKNANFFFKNHFLKPHNVTI